MRTPVPALRPNARTVLRPCATISNACACTLLHPARVRSKTDYIPVLHSCWTISHVSDSLKVWRCFDVQPMSMRHWMAVDGATWKPLSANCFFSSIPVVSSSLLICSSTILLASAVSFFASPLPGLREIVVVSSYRRTKLQTPALVGA